MASITLTRVPDPLEFGVIMTDEDGRVTQFLEKPSLGRGYLRHGQHWSLCVGTRSAGSDPRERAARFRQSSSSRACLPSRWTSTAMSPMATGAMSAISTSTCAPTPTCSTASCAWPSPSARIWAAASGSARMWKSRPARSLFGPIYLGNEVKIKGDVRIYGPAVVRDYTVVDNYNRIERSIIWRNNYVGESCELRGVIITRQCSVKAQVVAYEGVVIGDNCVCRRGRGAPCQCQALAAQGDRSRRHGQGQHHLGQPGAPRALQPLWRLGRRQHRPDAGVCRQAERRAGRHAAQR